jgi:hypothetical protein
MEDALDVIQFKAMHLIPTANAIKFVEMELSFTISAMMETTKMEMVVRLTASSKMDGVALSTHKTDLFAN